MPDGQVLDANGFMLSMDISKRLLVESTSLTFGGFWDAALGGSVAMDDDSGAKLLVLSMPVPL